MKSRPPLSVVMPVRDSRPYLPHSVASILGQTHSDFEFVILDDACGDGSTEFLEERAARDPRVKLHRVETGLGAVAAANRVVGLSSGALVARMDADDVSHPRRLELQLEALRRRPDAVLVGAMNDGIDASGRRVRGRDRWRLLRRSMFPPFPHTSVMFRREAFDAVGRYRESCGSWHDVDLMLRMADRGRVLVLPDELVSYRYHVGSVSHRRSEEEAGREAMEMWRALGSAGEAAPADPEAWAARYRDALRLWSGHPPGHGPSPGDTLPQRLRTGWQRRHPASLRACLRLLVAARDRAAGLAVPDGRVREWRYG